MSFSFGGNTPRRYGGRRYGAKGGGRQVGGGVAQSILPIAPGTLPPPSGPGGGTTPPPASSSGGSGTNGSPAVVDENGLGPGEKALTAKDVTLVHRSEIGPDGRPHDAVYIVINGTNTVVGQITDGSTTVPPNWTGVYRPGGTYGGIPNNSYLPATSTLPGMGSLAPIGTPSVVPPASGGTGTSGGGAGTGGSGGGGATGGGGSRTQTPAERLAAQPVVTGGPYAGGEQGPLNAQGGIGGLAKPAAPAAPNLQTNRDIDLGEGLPVAPGPQPPASRTQVGDGTEPEAPYLGAPASDVGNAIDRNNRDINLGAGLTPLQQAIIGELGHMTPAQIGAAAPILGVTPQPQADTTPQASRDIEFGQAGGGAVDGGDRVGADQPAYGGDPDKDINVGGGTPADTSPSGGANDGAPAEFPPPPSVPDYQYEAPTSPMNELPPAPPSVADLLGSGNDNTNIDPNGDLGENAGYGPADRDLVAGGF